MIWRECVKNQYYVIGLFHTKQGWILGFSWELFRNSFESTENHQKFWEKSEVGINIVRFLLKLDTY